jgi:hypothetical protein
MEIAYVFKGYISYIYVAACLHESGCRRCRERLKTRDAGRRCTKTRHLSMCHPNLTSARNMSLLDAAAVPAINRPAFSLRSPIARTAAARRSAPGAPPAPAPVPDRDVEVSPLPPPPLLLLPGMGVMLLLLPLGLLRAVCAHTGCESTWERETVATAASGGGLAKRAVVWSAAVGGDGRGRKAVVEWRRRSRRRRTGCIAGGRSLGGDKREMSWYVAGGGVIWIWRVNQDARVGESPSRRVEARETGCNRTWWV